MKFVSTREKSISYDLSIAIIQGLAPDGGLFVPAQWPKLNIEKKWRDLPLDQFAEKVLTPFFHNDPLLNNLKSICQQSLNIPLPCLEIAPKTQILELFHGPTCAFKDFGARFLASCFNYLQPDVKNQVVLVATSGDTGGAVAAAFSAFTKIPVCILYPHDQVSPRQEQQLTCWGDQVKSLCVEGSFDDCQRLVKEAFVSPHLQSRLKMISANSINLARLLPQMVYFAYTSLKYADSSGTRFIIPSGNMGNAAAALWAKELGFPIAKVIFAHNANKTVTNYFQTGDYQPQKSVSTLANAMDVGHPSNFERILNLYPDHQSLLQFTNAFSVTDTQIKESILFGNSIGQCWCPHTATAAFVRFNHTNAEEPWIIVSTAHPAKFESIVEPIIGKKIAIPQALSDLLQKPSHKTPLAPNLESLITELKKV